MIRSSCSTIFLKFGGQAEEPEPEPEERTMTILELTERLGQILAGFKVFEDLDLNEQQVAATRQGIVKMLACLLACLLAVRRC